MLVSMMLPAQVLMIPQYLWYQKLGWVGTYLPLIVPYCFAVQGFFVYLIMNFINGIPTELDEAAKIDGCSYYSIFSVLFCRWWYRRLLQPASFPLSGDGKTFCHQLLYVNKSELYPISLALKLFCDPASTSDYGAMFSMSVLSILPLMIIFILLQRYLVEGIASSGIKGIGEVYEPGERSRTETMDRCT